MEADEYGPKETPMIRRFLPTLAGALLFLLCAAPALALEQSSYTMEILVDGKPLPEYHARDTTYIEALEGREYTVRLRNRTGERVAIALSVDGLNSIDAKTTTAREASKWILGPWETITVGGWQTSSSSARKFFFTTEQRSYGEWLGKTKNLGVVTVAVFREKYRRPIATPRHDSPGTGRLESGERGAAKERMSPAPGDRSRDADSKKSESLRENETSDELAATGIGREYGHSVRRVRFDAESSPATVLELRYEYRDALVRLGVLPRPYICNDAPLSRRERAHGFEEMQFAPDPYGK
jgi:hypothetical protein